MELYIRGIIGPDSNAINWWQMVIRGFLVFFFALALIRLGDKRIFGKSTAFDIVLGIILGSILSRAITGNAPFFPAIITSFALVALHWLLAKFAFYSKMGSIVKGHEQELVKNGELQHEQMRKFMITEHDIYEALRISGKTQQLDEVEAAFLERNGSISVVTKK